MINKQIETREDMKYYLQISKCFLHKLPEQQQISTIFNRNNQNFHNLAASSYYSLQDFIIFMKITHPQKHEQLNHKTSSSILAFKIPYAIHQPSSAPKILTQPILQEAIDQEENISIGQEGFVTISKKKVSRPLYQIKVVRYQNKVTGEIVERIEQSKEVEVYYDYSNLTDFQRFTCKQPPNTHKFVQIMKNKIISQKEYSPLFTPPSLSFLKPYNLPILPVEYFLI